MSAKGGPRVEFGDGEEFRRVCQMLGQIRAALDVLFLCTASFSFVARFVRRRLLSTRCATRTRDTHTETSSLCACACLRWASSVRRIGEGALVGTKEELRPKPEASVRPLVCEDLNLSTEAMAYTYIFLSTYVVYIYIYLFEYTCSE